MAMSPFVLLRQKRKRHFLSERVNRPLYGDASSETSSIAGYKSAFFLRLMLGHSPVLQSAPTTQETAHLLCSDGRGSLISIRPVSSVYPLEVGFGVFNAPKRPFISFKSLDQWLAVHGGD